MLWFVVRGKTEHLANPISLVRAVVTVAGAICSVAGCALALRASDDVRDAQAISRVRTLFLVAAASIALLTVLSIVAWVSAMSSLRVLSGG